MYLIDPHYVISMPSVISYWPSNIRYMYNDHDHDRISFTCADWSVNTIFFFRPMVLASWPGGMTMTISFTCVYLLIWHDRGLPEPRWRRRSDLVGHPRRIRRWPDLLQWDPPVWRTASMMRYALLLRGFWADGARRQIPTKSCRHLWLINKLWRCFYRLGDIAPHLLCLQVVVR